MDLIKILSDRIKKNNDANPPPPFPAKGNPIKHHPPTDVKAYVKQMGREMVAH